MDKTSPYEEYFVLPPETDLDVSLKERIGDNLLQNSSDLNATASLDGIVALINLSDMPDESNIAPEGEDFFSTVEKDSFSEQPYSLLHFIRNQLSLIGNATIIDIGANQLDRRKTSKILRCAGFDEIELKKGEGSLIQVKKRIPVKYTFGQGKYTLVEVTTEEGIDLAMDFAVRNYKDKFNFKPDIDKQFSLHSDIFVVRETDDPEHLLGVLRYCWLVPGKYLPCMLAITGETGKHFTLPVDPKKNIGEVYAIWDRSLGIDLGFKQVYKELIRTNVLAMRNIEHTDYMFTTHEVNDKGAAALYKGNYRMSEAGAVLNYGSFGGKWALIYFNRDIIKDLYQHPGVIFQRRKQK